MVIRWALRAGKSRGLAGRHRDASQREREIERAWQRKSAVPASRVSRLGPDPSHRQWCVRASWPGISRMCSEAVRGLAGGIRITVGARQPPPASLPQHDPHDRLALQRRAACRCWAGRSDPTSPTGVEVGAARELLVPRHVPRSGRRLFIGRDAAAGSGRSRLTRRRRAITWRSWPVDGVGQERAAGPRHSRLTSQPATAGR